MPLPDELLPFTVDPDGTLRTTGHAVMAWWLGQWVDARTLHTREQLQALAAMIDKLTAASG
jgi:hypothetical protein